MNFVKYYFKIYLIRTINVKKIIIGQDFFFLPYNFIYLFYNKLSIMSFNEFQFTTVTVPKMEWDKLITSVEVLNEKITKLVVKHDKELLTKKEVMQLLKIGRTTLDRYIEEGILQEVKIANGKRGYIKYSQIQELMYKENKKR